MTAPITTDGFDAFWSFASARQQMYLGRLQGSDCHAPDPVLASNRFTNAYRASDRVSQFLLTDVQYDQSWDWADTFARTLVFKLFNRIGTWKHIVNDIGQPTAELLLGGGIDESLARVPSGRPIYSPAYIMPPPRNRTGPKFRRHLSLVRDMLRDGAHEEIRLAASLKSAFDVLRRYESIGDFLAFQYVIDLNYSRHLDFSESEFVVAGPGAKRGLRKCFLDPVGLSDSDLIRWTADQQYSAFERRGLPWDGLWGRDLQLIDVQNLFCEVDKYTRQALPHLSRFAAGDRIKQRYRPNPSPMTAWFPPKWGIEEQRVDSRRCGQMSLFADDSLDERELSGV